MCEESMRRYSVTCGQVNARAACRGLCALHSSKPVPRCTAVRAEGRGLLTEESEMEARWAGYFEQMYQAVPLAVELDVGVLLSQLLTLCLRPLFQPVQRWEVLQQYTEEKWSS